MKWTSHAAGRVNDTVVLIGISCVHVAISNEAIIKTFIVYRMLLSSTLEVYTRNEVSRDWKAPRAATKYLHVTGRWDATLQMVSDFR